MMMMTISSLVKYSQWPDTTIEHTEHNQKTLHLKNTSSIWDHDTKAHETETSTLWDRDQDQIGQLGLLWDRDRDRDQ